MDLLSCDQCGHRFYTPGQATLELYLCTHCGGHLEVSRHGIASIPLDAKWLDTRIALAGPEPVTVVSLRQKHKHGGRTAKRIVKELGDYFDLSARGQSVEVSVSRGEPEAAEMRVAAILDGVESSWEQHFYLGATDSAPIPSESHELPRRRGHLHLVGARYGSGPGAQA